MGRGAGRGRNSGEGSTAVLNSSDLKKAKGRFRVTSP